MNYLTFHSIALHVRASVPQILLARTIHRANDICRNDNRFIHSQLPREEVFCFKMIRLDVKFIIYHKKTGLVWGQTSSIKLHSHLFSVMWKSMFIPLARILMGPNTFILVRHWLFGRAIKSVVMRIDSWSVVNCILMKIDSWIWHYISTQN